jgi:hypothetical protein
MTAPDQKPATPTKKPTILTRNVVAIAAPIQHPAPPARLTAEQAEIWVETVTPLDPTWFRPESWRMLSSYCRHVVNAERLSPMVERAFDDLDAIGIADPEIVKAADKVAAMHEREVRAASSLATRLRITPQSTRTADQTKPAVKPAKPWDPR